MIVNSIIVFSTFPYYVGWFYELKKIIKILEEHREEFDVVMDLNLESGLLFSLLAKLATGADFVA